MFHSLIYFFQICFFISTVSTSDLHSLPVYHLLASRSPVLQIMDAIHLLEQGPCLTPTLTPRELWPALYWRNIIFFVSGKHRVSFSFFKYITWDEGRSRFRSVLYYAIFNVFLGSYLNDFRFSFHSPLRLTQDYTI